MGLIIIFFALRQFRKWNMRPVHWEPEEVIQLLESWIDGEETEIAGLLVGSILLT